MLVAWVTVLGLTLTLCLSAWHSSDVGGLGYSVFLTTAVRRRNAPVVVVLLNVLLGASLACHSADTQSRYVRFVHR